MNKEPLFRLSEETPNLVPKKYVEVIKWYDPPKPKIIEQETKLQRRIKV